MDLYSDTTRIICLVVEFVLYVTGISGNALIIWTTVRVKRLRIVQNVFVVLLAIIDLLIIGYIMPFAMLVVMFNKEYLPYNVCIFNAIFGHMLFSSCLELITCIAVSRYIRICHSHMFDKIYTSRNVAFMSVLCVIYWLIFFLPVVVLKRPFIFDKDLHVCIFNRFESMTYTYIYIVFCLIIPIIITAFSYINIYIYVRSAKLKLYKKWNNGLARRRLLHELTITRSQFAIFVAYLILYFPFGITTMLGFYTTLDLSWINTIGMYMAFVNSCNNSILYGLMNSNIREAYFEVLPCKQKTQKVRIRYINLNGTVSSTITSSV